MSDVVTTNQLMVVLESMRSDIKAVYEGYHVLSNQIADTKAELKEDIALVDAKVMGLAKRLDTVEERLSREINEARTDLADHRNNTEMHQVPRKRTLKKIA